MKSPNVEEIPSGTVSDGPAHVVIDVCVACGVKADGLAAGHTLHDALAAACADDPTIGVRAVECLAVCDRPVTVAFRVPAGWSYVIGDVSASDAVDDVIAAAHVICRSADGVPPMAERPPFFRQGVIGRLPPEPGVARGRRSGHSL